VYVPTFYAIVVSMSERRLPSLFRPRDLDQYDISVSQLRSMVREGDAERVSRGLYRLRSAEVTELETVAAVSALIPHGIVCLLSALAIHGIGTQLPPDVWIAIDRKARRPRIEDLPVRIVRFSGAMLRYAVETRIVQGVAVRITSPARTVVDCFRYRNKIGRDVALEALRDAIDGRRVHPDEIVRAAQVCRIYSVLRPYLQAMLA
jgi:predicted transcriptional regulator of viral defense system